MDLRASTAGHLSRGRAPERALLAQYLERSSSDSGHEATAARWTDVLPALFSRARQGRPGPVAGCSRFAPAPVCGCGGRCTTRAALALPILALRNTAGYAPQGGSTPGLAQRPGTSVLCRRVRTDRIHGRLELVPQHGPRPRTAGIPCRGDDRAAIDVSRG